MDPLRLCLSLGPVAIYLLLLGVINLSRRPLLVSGVRDAAALALATAGLAIIGPLELLFPVETAIRYGAYIWLWLLALYAMCVVLWLLVLRPRLVIYNISSDELRPVLAELAGRLDDGARWAGDSLSMPGLGVQLYLDSFAALGSVSLCSAGGNQNHAGWRRLQTALRSALAREEVPRSPRGLAFIFAGLLCAGVIAWGIYRDPQTLVQSVVDLVHALLQAIGLAAGG
ncbi:MAG: hypothetical protein LLG00_05200 [Planctomycetaceae bacterium]|nr:hypothetical protein [Planctomycetaceae bacterium]